MVQKLTKKRLEELQRRQREADAYSNSEADLHVQQAAADALRERGPLHIAQLALCVGCDGGLLAQSLMVAQLKGLITCNPGSIYEAVPQCHAAAGVPDADAEAHIDALCEQHQQA